MIEPISEDELRLLMGMYDYPLGKDSQLLLGFPVIRRRNYFPSTILSRNCDSYIKLGKKRKNGFLRG